MLIAGHDGGTGASPLSSIQAAGVPWEIGLAETQQTLLLNELRSRIVVQTDGQLKTGRDVVIAALLGADEMGFSTGPLIATGCIMMRACHLNTCPVGIATQDPELRKRFKGTPEHVVNFFFFVAEEVREILASLGLRSLDEAIGRVDLLEAAPAIDHWKARGVDLSHILRPHRAGRRRSAPARASRPRRCSRTRSTGSWWSVPGRRSNGASGFPCSCRSATSTAAWAASSQPHRPRATERRVCPTDSIVVDFEGSAGQSFGGWLAPGVTFTLHGDANDYTGKGLSGGVLAVRPRHGMAADFVAEENVIVGNTVLYGATSGRAFFRGLAGERFAVRNSGAWAVVEGVGDHGCEYMTGGRVVVLGPTGRNFAAGMSGGVAYVLDEDGAFAGAGRLARRRCNMGMVGFEELAAADAIELRALIAEHEQRTDSPVARRVLADWERCWRSGRLREGDAPRLQARAARARRRGRGAGRGGAGLMERAGLSAGSARGTRSRGGSDGQARRLPADRAPRRRATATRASARPRLPRVPRARARGRSCASRARAAWTAACPSATTAARWAT